MSKFKYKIIQILESGKTLENFVTITAHEKLDARAKIEMMYPSPEYKCEFIGTV